MTDRQQLLNDLNANVQTLLNEALGELGNQHAALHIAQQIEADQIYFEITYVFPDGDLQVMIKRRDATIEPIELMHTVRNKSGLN